MHERAVPCCKLRAGVRCTNQRPASTTCKAACKKAGQCQATHLPRADAVHRRRVDGSDLASAAAAPALLLLLLPWLLLSLLVHQRRDAGQRLGAEGVVAGQGVSAGGAVVCQRRLCVQQGGPGRGVMWAWRAQQLLC